jgi:hypothetical protein
VEAIRKGRLPDLTRFDMSEPAKCLDRQWLQLTCLPAALHCIAAGAAGGPSATGREHWRTGRCDHDRRVFKST